MDLCGQTGFREFSLLLGMFALSSVSASPVSAQQPGESSDESASTSDEESEESDGEDTGGEQKEETKTIQLTSEQKTLNNKAIEAMQGDSPKPRAAVRYLNAALLAGPKANLLYMALGRAYQLQQKCEKATETFQKAANASQVESVPRVEVMARIEKYRGDLEATCPGILKVECRPSSVQLSTKNRELECGEPTELPPDTYEVKATYEDAPPRKRTVEVVSMKQRQVRIEFQSVGPVDKALGEFYTALSNARGAQVDAFGAAATEQQRATAKSMGSMLGDWMSVRAEEAATGETSTGSKTTQVRTPGEAPPRDPMTEPSADKPRQGGFQTELRARVTTGGYLVQLKDGDIDGGATYGGSGAINAGWFFPPRWGIENQAQFDWVEASSLGIKTVDDLGEAEDNQRIDLGTWRFRDTLIGWLDIIGVGGFVDYRNQRVSYGPGQETTENTTTLFAGPALFISSELAFNRSGHFRAYGRWAPLFDGEVDEFQAGLGLAQGRFELNVEYERLTGQHAANDALRGGELLMLYFGARVPLF